RQSPVVRAERQAMHVTVMAGQCHEFMSFHRIPDTRRRTVPARGQTPAVRTKSNRVKLLRFRSIDTKSFFPVLSIPHLERIFRPASQAFSVRTERDASIGRFANGPQLLEFLSC